MKYYYLKVGERYVHFMVKMRVEGYPQKGWTSFWYLESFSDVLTPHWPTRARAEQSRAWWQDDKVEQKLPPDTEIEERDGV